MYACARELSGSRWGALVAAAIFTGAPSRLDHVMHLELLWTAWMPLAVLATARVFTGRGRAVWTLGAALAAQFLCCIYYGVFLFTVWPLLAGLEWLRAAPAPAPSHGRACRRRAGARRRGGGRLRPAVSTRPAGGGRTLRWGSGTLQRDPGELRRVTAEQSRMGLDGESTMTTSGASSPGLIASSLAVRRAGDAGGALDGGAGRNDRARGRGLDRRERRDVSRSCARSRRPIAGCGCRPASVRWCCSGVALLAALGCANLARACSALAGRVSGRAAGAGRGDGGERSDRAGAARCRPWRRRSTRCSPRSRRR